jgi:hypothetical protein
MKWTRVLAAVLAVLTILLVTAAATRAGESSTDPLTNEQRRALVFDPDYVHLLPKAAPGDTIPWLGPESTSWVRFGEDVVASVGDTVYVDMFFDVVVPADTIWLARIILDYDKTILNAVTVQQGDDAAAVAVFPALWLFTINFVGWECGDLIFLMDNYTPHPSWRGHAVVIGFEVLALEETEIGMCRIPISGDNQLALYHRGVEFCSEAWKPWIYSDLQDGQYDCVSRLITSDTVTVNPNVSSTLPVARQTWGAIKGLYK